MWVPNDTDKATITVSFPAWKDRVRPMKIEVPVQAEKPMTEKAVK